MTLEEACRLIDPATDLDALAEIEYYNGFKGKDAAAKALHEAGQMVVDFVRQMSWHDAKNPPIISVAVDEYMRLRMGQFEPLTEDLVFDGEDKKQLYEKPYDIRVYNERKHCIETMFEAAYKLAYPPFGHRERQHDSWGTCIDLVHAIEHQQWLDAPENKREAPGTTNRSFDPVPLGHEPFPKIEKVDE